MNRVFYRLPAIAAALLLMAPSGSCGAGALKVLDEAWDTVCRSHDDPEFSRKFRKLYETYRHEVAGCRGDREIITMVNRLLAETDSSHLMLLPPMPKSGEKAVKLLLNPDAARKNRILAVSGLRLLLTDSGLLVAEVSEEKAPDTLILPGDRIVEIDGVTVQTDRELSPSWGTTARALLMHGAPGSKVKVTVQRDRKLIADELVRKPSEGEIFQLGVIPPMVSLYESELRENNIAVVRFNLFVPENIKKFRREIRNQLKDCDALIIDLRGNPGGVLLYAEWLASWTSPKPVAMGQVAIDGTLLSPVSTPQPRAFDRPVAILVDRETSSTAEVYAAAMQDAGAAVVIGEKTSGMCLPSLAVNLPSGFRLQTVSGSITRAGGKEIEKNGVTPDYNVSVTPEGLRQGVDEVLEFAVRMLTDM